MLTTAHSHDLVTVHCYAKYYGYLRDHCVDVVRTAQQHWPHVVLSETAVYYVIGDEAGYYDAQVEHFRLLEAQLDTVWIWFTLPHNGWPAPYSVDMVASDGTPRAVYSEYLRYYGKD